MTDQPLTTEQEFAHTAAALARAEHDAQARIDARSEEEWLPEWLPRKLLAIKDQREEIKRQAKLAVKFLDAQERALKWKWGTLFKQIVTDRLCSDAGVEQPRDLDSSKGHRKSLPGRAAGFRNKKETIHITDEDALASWAATNCPDAVDLSIGRKTPILDWIRANEGEVPPGADYVPARTTFYPEVHLEESELALLPAGADDAV